MHWWLKQEAPTSISRSSSHMVDALETAILSLAQFPERGAIRRVGAYSNKDYRQLFLKNYTIIYRIVKQKKEVHVITIRYTPRFL